MKKILCLLVIVLFISGCDTKTSESFKYTKANNEERINLSKEKSYAIIDVRTFAEYDIEHIKGAINIPYTEIENSLIPDVDILFVYCRSGNRSKIAAEALIDLGYIVYDLGDMNNIDLEKE